MSTGVTGGSTGSLIIVKTGTLTAITASKVKAIGLVTETDTAQTISRSGQAIAVGLVTETDTALSVAPTKIKAVGLVTETDSALAITARKTLGVGIATETDFALSITSPSAAAGTSNLALLHAGQ